jgi:membrane-bound metal-dependent hydrolase YbcI (DUF457 family)
LTPLDRFVEPLESRRALLIALIVVGVADLVTELLPASVPQAVEGTLDEPAHVATVVIILAAFGWRFGRWFVIGALVGSVAVDLDHIPSYLGVDFLTRGTPRPYTHSLATVLIVGLLALAVRGHWGEALLGAGVGLLAHFFRDMCEPGQAGVALFWPISHEGIRLPYALYAATIVALVLVALTRRSRRR